MIIKKKVRLNDFLSCLDSSTVVKIWIFNPDDGSLEHFIDSKVKFISFKCIGSYFVQSVLLFNDLDFRVPELHINVMPDDLPF